MIDPPQIITTTAFPTAVIPIIVPNEEMMRQVIGPAYKELMGTIYRQSIMPAGAWFIHLRYPPTELYHFEIGLPVVAPIVESGRVNAGEWPAMRVARTTYHGPYDGLVTAWEELDAWIAAEGHKSAPDSWEQYARGPESNPEPGTWRTELSRPLLD